jgi:hypothetical protein
MTSITPEGWAIIIGAIGIFVGQVFNGVIGIISAIRSGRNTRSLTAANHKLDVLETNTNGMSAQIAQASRDSGYKDGLIEGMRKPEVLIPVKIPDNVTLAEK